MTEMEEEMVDLARTVDYPPLRFINTYCLWYKTEEIIANRMFQRLLDQGELELDDNLHVAARGEGDVWIV